MLRLTALAVCCTLALGACSPKDSASNQAQTASASAAQTEGASAIKQIDPVMVLKKDPKTKKET